MDTLKEGEVRETQQVARLLTQPPNFCDSRSHFFRLTQQVGILIFDPRPSPPRPSSATPSPPLQHPADSYSSFSTQGDDDQGAEGRFLFEQRHPPPPPHPASAAGHPWPYVKAEDEGGGSQGEDGGVRNSTGMDFEFGGPSSWTSWTGGGIEEGILLLVFVAIFLSFSIPIKRSFSNCPSHLPVTNYAFSPSSLSGPALEAALLTLLGLTALLGNVLIAFTLIRRKQLKYPSNR